MKFGIVQPNNLPGVEDVLNNRIRNGKVTEDLFRRGADLVVLPECSDHQYILSSMEEVRAYGESLKGPSVSFWKDLASKWNKYIVGGIIEKDSEQYYNTAVLVGPDGYVGHYRKVHLFNWEKDFLTPGNLGFPVFYLKDFDVYVSMLICYDLRFSEAVRTVAMRNCDVLLVPTTWTSIGKKVLWDERGYCLANYLAISHSYSNKLSIVCANRAGEENGVQFMGSSIIVNASSKVVGGPAANKEADQLLAEIDPILTRNKNIGNKNNLLKDRRPEYYF